MTHDDTNTSSLTLEALLAASAARTPAEQERDLAYADAATLGLHAQELANHHLARGDLTNAHRWYEVAVHYDIPGAADALNDVGTLIEVTTNIKEHHNLNTTDPANTFANGDAHVTILNDLAAAASLVRQAHEHAAQLENRSRTMLDDAREEANRIITSARHEAERTAGIAAAARTLSRLTERQGWANEEPVPSTEQTSESAEPSDEAIQQALDKRVVIEQAKSVLAERLNVTMGDAFALLRNYARIHRVRLGDLSLSIMDGTFHTDISSLLPNHAVTPSSTPPS